MIASPRAVQNTSPSHAVNTVLARLIQLSVAAFRADSLEKTGNIIVNQVHTLAKTDRAVLVPLLGRKRIFCISGDLEPSQDNPFSQAVDEVRKFMRRETAPREVSADEMPHVKDNMPNTVKVLQAMGGTRLLWLPLFENPDEPAYALWLERWNNKSWNQEEIKLLSHASVFFGKALAAPKTKRSPKRGKIVMGGVCILFVLLMWFPVRSRVSAPFQVIPEHPYYVFAPFDGVVEELAVQPGEKVKKGDLIFRYDTRVLEKRLEESYQAVAAALAELARLEGAGYEDQEARAKIPVQKLEVERKQSEVNFIKKQLELSEVRTEDDGLVVLDDPDALIGASLHTGEMVLRIADPERSKPRIMVPVADAGLVTENSPINIRLDSDPLKVIPARVKRIGFDVRMSDERVPSVLVDAVWEEKAEVSPGQRGIAKIQGPEVRLGMQFFRKPLASLRTLLGI
jgi:hypothetical protein